jgi:hypothetical protein
MVAVHVLERGEIYFFYRPRVGHEGAQGLADVQRLYVILRPRDQRLYRLIIVPEKRLPATSGDDDRRAWAFVEKVTRDPQEVEDALDPEAYDTKTRGPRERPAARPVGEGVYAIVRHEGHTHLAYALELPLRPGEAQRALNIGEEGSYILAVKNPEAPSPPGAGLDEAQRARYPPELRERFGGRRFASADPPELLDYPGAEIVLVGASQDVSAELGVRLERDRETEATADIFRDLGVEKSLHPLTPLFEGKWA